MRVLLRALSLAAALSLANAAFACPANSTHELSKAEAAAPMTELALLNHEDESPASWLVMSAEAPSPDQELTASLPSGVDFDLSSKILVDDEGEPLTMHVASTGSLGNASEEAPSMLLALDGYEDR